MRYSCELRFDEKQSAQFPCQSMYRRDTGERNRDSCMQLPGRM